MRLQCLGSACGRCCSVMGGGVAVRGPEAAQLQPSAIRHCGASSLLRDNNGACALLKNNVCSYYKARPRGCQEYPWYNIAGQLYYDKGCPGIRFDYDDRPIVGAITSAERYFQCSKWVRLLLLFIFRLW